MATVTLTIDGQSVVVPKGTLIVEAARKLGIEIPVYCYHPKMAPVGACRVCVVNVEGQRRPIMPACATEVMEGMVVHTRDKAATAAREGVLELLLINHPLDCPVCDRAGECDLQDFTLRYGPPKSRFREEKRHFEKSIRVGRDIVLDNERCIMCMRCVRFCSEVAVEEGLAIIERGTKASVGPFPGKSFDSQFSGNTVEICPVGALTSHTYRFKSRPWELQNFSTICNACSVGCNITADVRYDKVARFRSRCNDAIDDGWLCDKGRYGYTFVNSPERLKLPMVRKDGKLVETTWGDAILTLKDGLKKYKPEEVGAVAGPKLGNEAAWQLVRLMRSTIGSGNLDHRRGRVFSEGKALPLSAKIEGLDTATAVVVIHANPTKNQPVLDLRIKKAITKHGAGLVVIGDAGELNKYANVHLDSVQQALDAVAAFQPAEKAAITHPKPHPWEPGGSVSHDPAEAAKIMKRSEHVVVIFDENSDSKGIVELAETLGCLDKKPHGLMMCVAGANSTGLREMGVLPVFAPGWQKLDDVKAISTAWSAFSSHQGEDYATMTGPNSKLKALLMMAEDKLEKKPEFLAVVDLFMSPAAEQADVVLPASTFLEQVQTLTSMDGTVQLCRQALPSQGETLPDYKILLMLAEAMGETWGTDTPVKIFAEIGRLNPLYQGASYRDFNAAAETHWSYPQQARIGTPRPDLSGIPVREADAAPWMTAVPTGSKVERAARSVRNPKDLPPAVPHQEDPRRVAARMALDQAIEAAPHVIEEGAIHRVHSGGAPQPPGPSPAARYHHTGMRYRELPVTASIPPPREEPEAAAIEPEAEVPAK